MRLELTDAGLLQALWRQPSPAWTFQVATEIARRLPVDEPVDESVGEWFDAYTNTVAGG
ncbi:hypothetical protein [Streptomyces achromogenes]|uniref:hypothetical protein n=1 Tax=Streptomyces achromogenes TaxID=67255 RepID=UPI003700B7E6